MSTKPCGRCNGQVEPIHVLGELRFYLCRACKIPYNESGSVIVDLKTLNSSFNPLKTARGIIKGSAPDATPLAKTALGALATQGYLDAYMAGLKDGILLAYSQDMEAGGPLEGFHGTVPGAAGGSS